MTQLPDQYGHNIVQVAVHIRGTRPLWQHKFGPEALPLTPQEKTGVAGNDPEEWRKTCMIDAQGQPYVHDTYLFAAIREGGRYLKKGRSTLMRPIAATLQVLDDPIPVSNRFWPGYENGQKKKGAFDPTQADPPAADFNAPLYLDVRGVRNPSTRNRNIRYRVAISPGWEMHFTIQFDKSVVSREEMHSAVIQTGALVGIGSGRAIGKGRFAVVDFLEIDAENRQ